MDIQKEREAFEQHLTDTGLVEFSDYGFAVDECDEYLHEPTQVAWDSWLIGLNRAKAQAVPEGFVLVSAEQMSQWGHMANYAEQYGCSEWFEARGYAHSLACEINEFFAIEPQEPTND